MSPRPPVDRKTSAIDIDYTLLTVYDFSLIVVHGNFLNIAISHAQ